MSDRGRLLDDFKKAVAGVLTAAMEGMSDENKIALATILQRDPGSLRLHVRLEPLTISGAVFSADRSTPPIELFRIVDAPKVGDFN
jgi:hypothetical protein